MAALAFALHILGAVVWVGGMFAIYVCLRPALVTLEPPQRLRLMRVGDEGGPFEFGNQVLISSHRKLLRSKAVVVSVAETSGHDPGRHG